MGYQTKQFLYFFRKLSRSEDKYGNLRKISIAMGLAMLLIYSWNNLIIDRRPIKDHEEVFLLSTIFSLRGPIPTPKNIAIVKIDDWSYQKLDLSTRRPFPRKYSADAIRAIQADQPKVIILDLHAPKENEDVEGTLDLIDALKIGPATIAKAPIGKTEEHYVSDERIRDAAAMELPLLVDSNFGMTYYITRSHNRDLPTEEAVPLLQPLLKYVDPNLEAPAKNSFINFYGPNGEIPSYSIWELFSEKRMIPKGYFKDKIVFVGFASDLRMRGMSDKEILDVTAPGRGMYGVEIHANIAGNLIEKNWINRASAETESLGGPLTINRRRPVTANVTL